MKFFWVQEKKRESCVETFFLRLFTHLASAQKNRGLDGKESACIIRLQILRKLKY